MGARARALAFVILGKMMIGNDDDSFWFRGTRGDGWVDAGQR